MITNKPVSNEIWIIFFGMVVYWFDSLKEANDFIQNGNLIEIGEVVGPIKANLEQNSQEIV
jgi:hypothetical protein